MYVTGRTRRGDSGPAGLPGTIDETAETVTRCGGRGIAIRCDHRDDGDVRRLFERVERDEGRLDLLVNNVWGGYERLHGGRYELHVAPFWEQPLSMWDEMFDAGPRAHYVASALAARLLVRSGGGLIVNVSSFAATAPDPNVAYGAAKFATDGLTVQMADRLREHGVAVVSLYPGLVRTEGIMKWAEFMDLSNSESPELAGRAVRALAADPDALERTGHSLVVAELAEEYGFTDVDGAQPRSLRPELEEAF